MYIIRSRDGDKWNHGLGCRERDVKEKLRRIEGETGRRFEEVGNESAKVKPKPANYDLTAKEFADVKEILSDVDGD